jgi:hypothetical protein
MKGWMRRDGWRDWEWRELGDMNGLLGHVGFKKLIG